MNNNEQMNNLDLDKKNEKNKMIILVTFIIILVIVAIIEVIFLTSNKDDNQVSETVTTTEEADDDTTRSVIIYKSKTSTDSSILNVSYLSYYNKSADINNKYYDIIYQYDCNGYCVIDKEDDSYIYDEGTILKINDNQEFEKIDVLTNTLDIEKYGVRLMYFEDEDNFIGFEFALDGNILDNVSKTYTYTFYYNKGLIDNGYVLVTSPSITSVYDYKNQKIIDYNDDDNNNIRIYDNFIDYGNGLKTNNLKTIIDGDNYSSKYYLNDGYAYIYEDTYYSKYDNNGNLVDKTKKYNKLFLGMISGTYALGANDNKYILVDISNDKVIVEFDREYDEKYSEGFFVITSDEKIVYYLDSSDCGLDASELKFTYYFSTGEGVVDTGTASNCT